MAAPDDGRCSSVEGALQVLGRPWTGLILYVLQGGPLRFSELSQRLPNIGDRMLSVRLKQLEARDLVERGVDAGPPVRVSYRLTAIGAGLREVMEAIDRWSRAQLAPARARPKRRPRAGGRPRSARPRAAVPRAGPPAR